MTSQHFPHEIKKVTDEEEAIIKKYYTGYDGTFVRVGSAGYLSMPGYAEFAAAIYNLEVKPDDVWVLSFSRSGTTWLQELVWLVHNNLDFQALKDSGASRGYVYVESLNQVAAISTVIDEILSEAPQAPSLNPKEARATIPDFRALPGMPSPRYIKSHLPLSLLPPKLLNTAKVFYIARDPRDVAVSSYFFHKLFRYFDESVTMKEFWDLFRNDLIKRAPILHHIKEAWQAHTHPNLLFLFYEDMKRDLPGSIDKVCSFLGKEYTTQQKEQLAQHLRFDNMKKKSPMSQNKENPENNFIRKGQSGNWVQYFDEEMQRDAEDFMEKNLARTDLRFPSAQ